MALDQDADKRIREVDRTVPGTAGVERLVWIVE